VSLEDTLGALLEARVTPLRVAVESLAELEWDPARQIGTPTSRNNGQNTGAAL